MGEGGNDGRRRELWEKEGTMGERKELKYPYGSK